MSLEKHPKKNIYYHGWDWKDEPSWATISAVVAKGFKGLTAVDTGGDCYGVLLTKKPISFDEAQAIYDKMHTQDWSFINDLTSL